MNEETHENVSEWSKDITDIASIEFENAKQVEVHEENYPPAKIQIGSEPTTYRRHVFVYEADKITIKYSEGDA